MPNCRCCACSRGTMRRHHKKLILFHASFSIKFVAIDVFGPPIIGSNTFYSLRTDTQKGAALSLLGPQMPLKWHMPWSTDKGCPTMYYPTLDLNYLRISLSRGAPFCDSGTFFRQHITSNQRAGRTIQPDFGDPTSTIMSQSTNEIGTNSSNPWLMHTISRSTAPLGRIPSAMSLRISHRTFRVISRPRQSPTTGSNRPVPY